MITTTSMQTDRQGILSAIIDDPDDDTPRLAYADWLEENGGTEEQDRAEFIRVQVALAKLSDGDSEVPVLSATQGRLLAQHGSTWKAEVGDGLKRYVDFSRGFIEAYSGPAKTYFRQAQRLHARTPLRRVSLHFRHPADPGRWPDTPTLGCLEKVSLLDQVDFPTVQDLCSAPWGVQLTELAIRINDPDEPLVSWRSMPLVTAITTSPYLTNLQWLSLLFSPLGEEDLAGFASGCGLPRLKHLSLCGDDIRPGGARLLAQASFPRLSSLSLGCDSLGAEGTAVLAGAPWMGKLQSLGLIAGRVGDGGVIALASSPNVAKLRVLHLDNNYVTDVGARALADSPYLQGLKELHMGRNPLSDQGRELLRARFGHRLWLMG